MATPYFQKRFETVPSTQDVAREHLTDLPLLVIASAQTKGRGRSGAGWLNADRALASSLAFKHEPDDRRPHSLMAGVAAVRALGRVGLKWPNDLLLGSDKVGGILVEKTPSEAVIGIGVNLWWADPPDGMVGLFADDPGPDRHAEIGALWGAELMDIIEQSDWPHEEYTAACLTIGEHITWEPDGSGVALGVSNDGALVVDGGGGEELIYSGSVRHVRASD